MKSFYNTNTNSNLIIKGSCLDSLNSLCCANDPQMAATCQVSMRSCVCNADQKTTFAPWCTWPLDQHLVALYDVMCHLSAVQYNSLKDWCIRSEDEGNNKWAETAAGCKPCRSRNSSAVLEFPWHFEAKICCCIRWKHTVQQRPCCHKLHPIPSLEFASNLLRQWTIPKYKLLVIRLSHKKVYYLVL